MRVRTVAPWSRCVCAALLLNAAGCARQERVVSYRPMMSDLPGATIGSDVVGDDESKRRTAADSTPDYFVEEEDGTLTAQIPTGAYLVYHVRKALETDDEELFTSQLLSDMTKQEFKQRELDPRLAFAEIKRRRKDVDALFRRMPQGELSPGIHLQMLSRKVARVRMYGEQARALAWDGFDMVFENDAWRLRWFTTGEGKSLAN